MVVAFLIIPGVPTAAAEAQSKRDAAAVHQVLQLIDKLKEAQIHHDAATLKSIYADDYTLTEGDGTVFTKSQRITAIEKLKFDSIRYAEINLRTYGNTAVLTSRATVRFREKPLGPFSVRVTIVVIRMDGRWQIVAAQESDIIK